MQNNYHKEFINGKFLVVSFVDYTELQPGFNWRSYSQSDTLIKYSEAKYSPVSSCPKDSIQLGTPSYYQNIKEDDNLNLVGDDKEGIYFESINWEGRGSPYMEDMKERFSKYSRSVGFNVQLQANDNQFLIYCVSIDPVLDYERKNQMECLSSDYDFMMGIEDSSMFAIQLGRDVAQQIMCDAPLIKITHGPVIYVDDGKNLNWYGDSPNLGSIIQFVKREKYQEQQEYRFVVHIPTYKHEHDVFRPKVSEDLRDLLKPISQRF